MKVALFGGGRVDSDRSLAAELWRQLRQGEADGVFKLSVHKALAYLGDAPVFDQDLPADTDVLLSLGGDGTLLDTLPLVRNSGVKVLGVNMGSLGFLSGADRNEIVHLAEALRLRQYDEEKRSVLEIETSTPGLLPFPYALNEAVVFKCDTASLISVSVRLGSLRDGSGLCAGADAAGCGAHGVRLLNVYHGDGVIFATATGSTAYSLSCGGPILSPEMEAFLITPIASHTLTVRPVLLPCTEPLEVEVACEGDFRFSLDSYIRSLSGPLKFRIRQADFKLTTLRLRPHSFFTTLRQKLMWGADGRRAQEG